MEDDLINKNGMLFNEKNKKLADSKYNPYV